VSEFFGVDSEVGRLRTVLVHRPGAELRRVTPRHERGLLFAALPWAERAQEEHDAFTDALRGQGVAVLYLTELLQDALEYEVARRQATRAVLSDARLGDELRGQLSRFLHDLPPEELAQLLILGLARGEFRDGRGAVFGLLDAWDYLIDPLPNLVFARDTSVWIGDSVAVTSPRGRRAEAEIASIIFGHHPQFTGTKSLYEPGFERLAGGDVLLLAPGVLAVGVGERTTAPGAERLAQHAMEAGLAHTVLAIPVDQRESGGYLDTLCTVVDAGAVLMHPAMAYTLTAHLITLRDDGLRVSRAQPFLEAAAQAQGIEQLRLIDTGLDPVCGPRGQWDDGSNALAIGGGVAICHERNTETISRLEAAGQRVVQVPGSELSSSRGGPRGMCCPVSRDPARAGELEPAQVATTDPVAVEARELAPA
jgi:arginine deiminase